MAYISIMDSTADGDRYIIWRPERAGARAALRSLLEQYPAAAIIKAKDPDMAVVVMNAATEKQIRERNPDLVVERDVRHRPAARSQ